jgi:hypothetical protein
MTFGKRIDQPGGLRRAVRGDILIRAAMMTLTETVGVDLLDLSTSGAKLRGRDLPAPGQEVVVLLGRLEAFGWVIWRDEDQCGVHFDVPLSENARSIVESERGPNFFATTSGEDILAASDWHNGLAR